MPFTLWARTGRRNHELDGSRSPVIKGQFWGKGSSIVKYRDFLTWAVQKRLNRSICRLGYWLGWAEGSTSSTVFWVTPRIFHGPLRVPPNFTQLWGRSTPVYEYPCWKLHSSPGHLVWAERCYKNVNGTNVILENTPKPSTQSKKKLKILGPKCIPRIPSFSMQVGVLGAPYPIWTSSQKSERGQTVGGQSINFPIKRPKIGDRPPNFVSTEVPLVGENPCYAALEFDVL